MARTYEAKCVFCGEDVGVPEDSRGFYGFRDVTYYPPGSSKGIHICQRDGDSPGDRAVHEDCWVSYWSGICAGQALYKVEEED